MYFKLAFANVKKSIRSYGIYFITLVFGVCVFYAFNSFTQQSTVLGLSGTQDSMLDFLSSVIGGVSVFVAIVLGFLIIYANKYLIRRRKQEFGTYLLLGMQPGKVSRIIVYETLCVGVISLAIGLIVGILLSQVLFYITAALFAVKMDMFVFVFSWSTLVQTVLYFGVIFITALLFNVISVSRYKLINLIYADRKNEALKLRSIPLSVVLFLISLVLIGVSYALLTKNGLAEINVTFLIETAMVCVGTFLFFYAFAGFVIRLLQSSKGLYLRGLNMFTIRQLGAKINTAFASVSIVCLALFLAITSTCGGIAICSTLNQNIESNTKFDASLRTVFLDIEPDSEENPLWYLQAVQDDFDMEATLSRDIDTWDELVKDAAQIDFYTSDISLQFILDHSEATLSPNLYTSDLSSAYLYLMPLSSLNEQRQLLGMESLELAPNEYLLWSDFGELINLYESFVSEKEDIELYGTTFHASDQELQTILTETGMMAMNTGTFVVPDEQIAEEAPRYCSVINVMYNESRDKSDPLFNAALQTAYFDPWQNGEGMAGWPFNSAITALEMQEQNVGLSLVIAYVAIYIGFVLLIACAAILALQQLSEAADNVSRYSLLQKLGVDETMVNKALFEQIGIYFIFPLVLAFCHALVALNVVLETAALFGISDTSMPLAITLGLFLLIYGGYFLVTYFASRAMVRRTTA